MALQMTAGGQASPALMGLGVWLGGVLLIPTANQKSFLLCGTLTSISGPLPERSTSQLQQRPSTLTAPG